MMPAVMQFDTLDYAKRLEIAGVPAAQAEAQAKALGDALGKAVAFPGDLVTLEKNLTQKLTIVETRLETKIDTVKNALETRIDTLKNELETRIDTLKNELETKIDTLKIELRLDLGGKIETLKWMFGALVALNVTILVRLLYIH